MWLIFCLVVLWTAFPPAFGSIMTTLSIPLSLAVLGHRPARRGLRLSARSGAAVAAALSGRHVRDFVGADAVLLRDASSAASPRAGCRSAMRPATWSPAGSTRRRSSSGLLAVAAAAYLAAVFLVTDAHRRSTRTWKTISAAGPSWRAVVAGVIARRRRVRAATRTIRSCSRRSRERGWPLLLLSGVMRHRRAGDPASTAPDGRRALLGALAVASHHLGLGSGPVPVSVAGVAHDLRGAGAPRHAAVAGRRRGRGAGAAGPSVTAVRVPPRPAKPTRSESAGDPL